MFCNEVPCNENTTVLTGRARALPGFGRAKDLLGDAMFVAVGSDI